MPTKEVCEQSGDGAPVYHNSCFAMATRLNVVITDAQVPAENLFAMIINKVRQIEVKLSRFDEDSLVSAINRSAGTFVGMDAELTDVLASCIDYYRRTDGQFDITLPSRSTVAPEHESASVLRSLPEMLTVDSESRTVTVCDAAVQIDLGGFGKGYALGAIQTILKRGGVRNALVSFGESSILAMGHHPYGDCWKIGIENAVCPGQSAYVFELKDQSLSVSGFQRRSEGTPGFHIISPVTHRPIERTSTVAVLSADPLEAEVLSTAVYAAMDTETKFLENFRECRVVRVDYENDQLTEICTYE